MRDTLSRAQIEGLIEAARHAQKIGLSLGDFLTVHWSAMGVADHDAARATGRLLKLAGDLCRARGLPFAAIWTRENDAGDGSKGSHLHCLLHIPPEARRALVARLRPWLRAAAGRPYVRGAVALRRIGGRVGMAASNAALHAENLAAVLAYVCKGGDPETARALGLSRHGEGGRVIGKRAGWTENLGAAARRRAR